MTRAVNRWHEQLITFTSFRQQCAFMNSIYAYFPYKHNEFPKMGKAPLPPDWDEGCLNVDLLSSNTYNIFLLSLTKVGGKLAVSKQMHGCIFSGIMAVKRGYDIYTDPQKCLCRTKGSTVTNSMNTQEFKPFQLYLKISCHYSWKIFQGNKTKIFQIRFNFFIPSKPSLWLKINIPSLPNQNSTWPYLGKLFLKQIMIQE